MEGLILKEEIKAFINNLKTKSIATFSPVSVSENLKISYEVAFRVLKQLAKEENYLDVYWEKRCERCHKVLEILENDNDNFESFVECPYCEHEFIASTYDIYPKFKIL